MSPWMITLFVLALMVCAGSHKKQRTRNRSMPSWAKPDWRVTVAEFLGIPVFCLVAFLIQYILMLL